MACYAGYLVSELILSLNPRISDLKKRVNFDWVRYKKFDKYVDIYGNLPLAGMPDGRVDHSEGHHKPG